MQKGDTYSAASVSASEQSIRKYFGRLGYAFPKINTYPEVDEETSTVIVRFAIEPGQRGYVRHIIFQVIQRLKMLCCVENASNGRWLVIKPSD